MNDKTINEAFFVPKTGALSLKLFYFLYQNVDSAIILGGMSGRILAIDKDKLERMAERRGIDLPRYDKIVSVFIQKFILHMNAGENK